MLHRNQFRRWLGGLVLAGMGLLLSSMPAAAQCIMCYVSAAGSGGRGIRALQIGILVLLVPTLAILAAMVWITYRRRDSDGARTEDLQKDAVWDEDLTALAASPGTEGPSSRH